MCDIELVFTIYNEMYCLYVPTLEKSGMGKHKMAKNMFPTYTKRQIFEQLDRLHARGVYRIAFIKIALVI
jgi:hypothetical protein